VRVNRNKGLITQYGFYKRKLFTSEKKFSKEGRLMYFMGHFGVH
jgi:hypothetical protein